MTAHVNLLVVFCLRDSTKCRVVDQNRFFRALGQRVRQLREEKGFSQEDMLSFGFSARHWQQIEAGRPITMRTALRICGIFKLPLANLVEKLDRDIYK